MLKAEHKMILAVEVVKNPTLLDDYTGKYLILYDQSLTQLKFDYLNSAMNIAAERGWKPILMSATENIGGPRANYLYVMLERIS